MRDENNLYWIWLSEKFGIASKEFSAFAENYDDPYDVYRLEAEEIDRLEGISERLKLKLYDKSLESAYNTLKYCRKNGVDVIGYSDVRYPSRLRTIENPPVLLYCMGQFPDMNSRLCIGVVGTRKMSEYGKQSAYKISYELSAANVCVVSGMALGVDGVSACGAIAAGGVTVAVLGCGVSIAYPKEHTRLMKTIQKNGAVISEYPPFERPFGSNFPKRNRIISGLCQGVLVIEGAKGSGSLITAKKAIDQGRELFALPGQIDDGNAEGPNELIKAGANVALSATDIVSHYDFLYHDIINYKGLSEARTHSQLDESVMKKMGISVRQLKKCTVSAEENIAISTEEPQAYNCEKIISENVVREKAQPDKSSQIYESLDERTKEVFMLIPDGTAFSPDAIAAHGIDVGEAITALTMLEISGLILSLPGGLYIKK